MLAETANTCFTFYSRDVSLPSLARPGWARLVQPSSGNCIGKRSAHPDGARLCNYYELVVVIIIVVIIRTSPTAGGADVETIVYFVPRANAEDAAAVTNKCVIIWVTIYIF